KSAPGRFLVLFKAWQQARSQTMWLLPHRGRSPKDEQGGILFDRNHLKMEISALKLASFIS
ncbi:MAG: hypothetical protein DRQ47_08010, partial [Gammaproteobacteria bacterium]